MPFTRTRELAQLADQIASAMKRGDDIGMDTLRDILPELRETIDEVNLALREVDALLFEGLRDEAVSLHDETFARLVGRLNLEDLENWPVARQFFATEGINPPPAIDFETLSALESAHSELEQLRRWLDKLRRLALERSPLDQRLALLRKLRNADSSKPVWAEAIAMHEEARLAELKQAVPQALGARDPEQIAGLHVELVDPEWSIAVPRDLVRSTRGADLWLQLRAAVNQAEAAGGELETAHRDGSEGLPPPDLTPRLRTLRDRWYEAHRLAEACIASLAECPTVAGMARGENLEHRLRGLAPRAEAGLQWLQIEDARESTTQQFEQALASLEYLVDHPPEKKTESAWVADVEMHQAEAMRHCQTLPDLLYPELLRNRVAQSLDSVRGREGRRRRFVMLMSMAAVAVVGTVIAVVTKGCDTARRRTAAVVALQDAVGKARFGAFAEDPAFALDIETDFSDEPQVADLLETLRRSVETEADRRKTVQQGVTKHREIVQLAAQRLEQRNGRDRLDEWPAEVVEAAQAYRNVRGKGGILVNKSIPEDCHDARTVRQAEEEAIAECERQQEELERKLRSAAITEMREQLDRLHGEIEDLGEAPFAEEAVARAERAITQLQELRRIGELEKSARNDVLLTGDVRRRLPPDEMAAMAPLLTRLKQLVEKSQEEGAANQ